MDIIRYMMGHKLDFDPGSRYAYSNFGYCVLGRVIEKVERARRTRRSCKKAIFDPIGVQAHAARQDAGARRRAR